MKFREPALVRGGFARLGHCLTLLLLAGGSATSLRAGGRIRIASPSPLGYTWVDSLPYAIVAGVPPLRFAPEPPAPEPPAPVPPIPPPEAASASSSASSPDPAAAAILAAPVHPAAAALAEKSSTSGSPAVLPGKQPEEKNDPAPILPDDLHPQVRPEDFLPFFQVPGGLGPRPGARVNVVVPIPPTAPPTATAPIPSTATYQQTPQ